MPASRKVAAQTWKLVSQSKTGMFNHRRNEKETVYVYECGDETVSFGAHPTRAFQYVLASGDAKTANRVIAAHCLAGVNQHDFKGGFDEAIQNLSI